MTSLAYARANSFDEARSLLTNGRYRLPVLKSGGMDIVDLMKEGLLAPDLLIDVRSAHGQGDSIQQHGDRLWITPNATLAEIAASPIVRSAAPGLAQACESAATPQVRNVASAAGNLLQRPRCWYFRNEEFPCLKKGGATCYALEGENQYHAIFGDGPCYIVHPSNLAPALIVLDGRVEVAGADRDSIPVAELFHMPEQGVRSEHNLRKGEVITGITCSTAPTSGFYAIKEKQSFDWPLVFAVASLMMNGPTIAEARLCAGAVAPIPWRLENVEQALRGVSPADEQALRRACAPSVEGANPMSQNAYKTQLLPVAVRRAIQRAAGLPVEDAT